MADMANANATTVTKKQIVLTLDEEEVQALLEILSQVGGSPINSPRGKATDIIASLTGTGVKRNPAFSTDGSLYFRDFDGSQPMRGFASKFV